MLKVLGVIFLVLIVAFVGLLIWGYYRGSEIQEEFYEAVLSGDADRVLELFHPEFRKDIDEPVLAAWMKTFKAAMGSLKGLSKSNFSTKTENDRTTSEGTVEFEKGEVRSKLVVYDDKIVSFQVQSESLAGAVVGEPEDTTLFRDRGAEFFRTAAAGKIAESWGMMHENLQANVGSEEKLGSAMEQVREGAGALTEVKFLSEEFKSGGIPELGLRYELTWERAKTEGRIRFQFLNLKAHLVGYDFRK